MCGRALLTLTEDMIEEVLEDVYQVKQMTLEDYSPRYNIPPGQKMLSIINDGSINRAGFLEWKFIPPWAESEGDGYKYTNARSETIHQKVTYRESFFTRRCLVIVDGFYEWQRSDQARVPFLFYRDNHKPFALAGIWNTYVSQAHGEFPAGKKTYGLSIITTRANDLMAPIHHRMPVIIKEKDMYDWLTYKTPLERLQALMEPIEEAYLKVYQVSTYVNSTKNQGPTCIQRVS